jgi:hypothetical protein
MRRVNRFLRLSRSERTLLLQAAFSILAVRVGLRFLSFERLQVFACRRAGRATAPVSSDRIVWAVEAAARTIPASSCLSKALAAQALLARHGYASQLMIGVAKDEALRLEAHAWITCQDRVLIGGPETGRYTPLLNLEVRS